MVGGSFSVCILRALDDRSGGFFFRQVLPGGIEHASLGGEPARASFFEIGTQLFVFLGQVAFLLPD